ncbi:MAG: hypothetical protein SangKO_077510 [Sandaracinaceae bacterium]
MVGADFEYTQADGARTMNDIGTDWRANYEEAPSVDPMRQTPAPAVVDVEGMGRVESLRWSWDYLANTTSWTDNDDAFYERSIGDIGNGNSAGETSGSRPSALYVASNLTAGVTGSSNGWVEVDYGVGGNVVGMTVHAQCANGASACVDPGGDSDARRAALRANCDCATEQHYAYRWDELNRLAEARRYDYEGIAWVRKVRQRYRYDGANSRTVKQTLESGSTPEAIALYPYPGDFERRGLTRGATAYEASSTLETETQYVVAGARMVWKHGGAGAGYDRENRLAVPIGDLIQTTGAVFDVRSGELLEVSTYYPNGARETYLNDDSARAAPEVTGFTGKEADEEVGVVYFGERYLIPRLGRWASQPDPLHVHAVGGGEALNSYHYVSGSLLQARDPLGLSVELSAENRARLDGGEYGALTQVRETATELQMDPVIPTESSGVTIGWGYDIRGQPNAETVREDMLAIGLDEDQAQLMADAHGAASQQEALDAINAADIQISREQADSGRNRWRRPTELADTLFGRVIQRYEARAAAMVREHGISDERWRELDSDVREFVTDLAYVGAPLRGRRAEYVAQVLGDPDLNTAGQLLALNAVNRVIRTSNTLTSGGEPTGRQFSGPRGARVREEWLAARVAEHASPDATSAGLSERVLKAVTRTVESIRAQENEVRQQRPALGAPLPAPTTDIEELQ